MNWLIKTLAGAVVAGLGWKLGADAYERLKKEVEKRSGKEKKKEEKPAEDGAGAAQTAVAGGQAPTRE